MKKLLKEINMINNKIKRHLSIYKISKKELKNIKGGFCGCGCYYADCGGSSSDNNGSANYAGGKTSIPPIDPSNPC